MKQDPEIYLLAIRDYLMANLNTEIGSLNTEKNDSIVLSTVSSSAYFIQTLNDTVANYNPHVFVGLDDVVSVGIGPGTLKQMTFSVIVILEDRGMDLFIGQRLLRYGRVLEDLFNRSFNKILPHATFKVNSLVPIALTAVNSNDPYRAVGVQIQAALG